MARKNNQDHHEVYHHQDRKSTQTPAVSAGATNVNAKDNVDSAKPSSSNPPPMRQITQENLRNAQARYDELADMGLYNMSEAQKQEMRDVWASIKPYHTAQREEARRREQEANPKPPKRTREIAPVDNPSKSRRTSTQTQVKATPERPQYRTPYPAIAPPELPIPQGITRPQHLPVRPEHNHTHDHPHVPGQNIWVISEGVSYICQSTTNNDRDRSYMSTFSAKAGVAAALQIRELEASGVPHEKIKVQVYVEKGEREGR